MPVRSRRRGGGAFFVTRLRGYPRHEKFQFSERSWAEEQAALRSEGRDLDYEIREAAITYLHISPSEFRNMPAHDQVEILGHLRERDLRKAYADHVAKVVSEMDDPTKPKDKK